MKHSTTSQSSKTISKGIDETVAGYTDVFSQRPLAIDLIGVPAARAVALLTPEWKKFLKFRKIDKCHGLHTHPYLE